MAIDRAEVERIAALARLEIAPENLDRTAAQLSQVLDFVSQLGRLDLEGLEPTTLAPGEAPLREDAQNGRRLTQDQALASAPAAENGFFLVPQIVENVAP